MESKENQLHILREAFDIGRRTLTGLGRKDILYAPQKAYVESLRVAIAELEEEIEKEFLKCV